MGKKPIPNKKIYPSGQSSISEGAIGWVRSEESMIASRGREREGEREGGQQKRGRQRGSKAKQSKRNPKAAPPSLSRVASPCFGLCTILSSAKTLKACFFVHNVSEVRLR